jgi:hypothetical protein
MTRGNPTRSAAVGVTLVALVAANLLSRSVVDAACLPAAECNFQVGGHSFDLSPLCDPSGQGTTINDETAGKTYQINM